MQTVSSNFLASAQGSSRPVFYADLWKDGYFVQTLPLESGDVSFDANADVQGSAHLIVADPDGTLAPTSMGSDLTPFGSQINIRAGFNIGGVDETVSLGWFIIWDMDVEEAWMPMTDTVSGQTQLVRKGSRINLSLRDLSQKIVDYAFLVPTAPTQSTAWAEIVWLVGDIIQTQTPSWPGFADVTLANTSITYGDSRFQAVKDLAALFQAEPVMTPDGYLTLEKINAAQDSSNTAPTFGWDVNLTEYKKALSREGVFNIVVARGKDTNNNGLVAYSILDQGPTSFYSEFGPRPAFYDSDTLATPAALQAWADSLLATITTRNTQTVPVKALPNPAIELGDYANLSIQGSPQPVTCRIIGWTYRDTGEMDVNLSMPKGWLA